jgi:flagellar hook-basal body complex protein FliE
MPVDKVSSSVAAGLYANAAKSTAGIGVNAGDKTSFGDLIEKAARDSVEVMKEGEKASAKAITGEASLTDVVEAVSAAEMTLQTVVAVRDRMLSAYQEIMRMPI